MFKKMRRKAWEQGRLSGQASVRAVIAGPGCDKILNYCQGVGGAIKISQPVHFEHTCNDGRCNIEEKYLLEWTVTLESGRVV